MLLIPLSKTLGAVAEFHQSAFIDFPIWALLYDGLEIEPFNKHGENIGSLQALGMDKKSWEAWFRKLVLSQHTGLRLQNEGLPSFMKERKDGVNTIPLIIDGMRGAESAQMPDSDILYERYYSLVEKLSSRLIPLSIPSNLDDGERVYRALTPVDLWDGSQEVRGELERLWTSYRSEAVRRVHHAHDLHRLLVEDNNFALEVSTALKNTLDGQERLLLFNFANYISNVFMIVDSSVVIGLKPVDVDKPFPIETVKELLVDATLALATSTERA